MNYEGLLAETVVIRGHNGDKIDAYFARPLGPGPHPSVVLIHHMPGWDEASKEMARKLAYHGFATISPNLHFREGKSTPQENSTSVREAGGMPDDRTLGDVEGSMDFLRSQANSNGKVGVIGFCSGGRQTYLVACRLAGVDAAVDCWGGGVTQGNDSLTERMPEWPVNFTAGLSCPLLGLFGEEDGRPSPADVAETEEALKKHGKTYEFHMYPGAGHGFFAVDRPSYHQESAVDGWEKVLAWFGRYLSSDAAAEGAKAGRVGAAVPAGDS